jgi:hypothetical protein
LHSLALRQAAKQAQACRKQKAAAKGGGGRLAQFSLAAGGKTGTSLPKTKGRGAKRAKIFALKNKGGDLWPQKKQSAYICNFKKR